MGTSLRWRGRQTGKQGFLVGFTHRVRRWASSAGDESQPRCSGVMREERVEEGGMASRRVSWPPLVLLYPTGREVPPRGREPSLA
jgi:hypothetical protein